MGVRTYEPIITFITLLQLLCSFNPHCFCCFTGELLASCSDDSTAKIWTAEQGLKYDLRGHLKEIFTLRWTPTGPASAHPDKPLLLCTASFDGTVKVWSGASGELVFNLCKQVQPVYSLAPSPDGTQSFTPFFWCVFVA